MSVLDAQQIKSQVTLQLPKIENANQWLQTNAGQAVKFNWTKPDALPAQDVKEIKFWIELTIFVLLLQDQYVLATNNTTLLQTDVTTANQTLSLETAIFSKIELANHTTTQTTALPTTQFNWAKKTALLAEHAMLDKLLEIMYVLLQELYANATKLWMLKINAKIADQINLLTQLTQDVSLNPQLALLQIHTEDQLNTHHASSA
jgi:hypothetical protein